MQFDVRCCAADEESWKNSRPKTHDHVYVFGRWHSFQSVWCGCFETRGEQPTVPKRPDKTLCGGYAPCPIFLPSQKASDRHFDLFTSRCSPKTKYFDDRTFELYFWRSTTHKLTAYSRGLYAEPFAAVLGRKAARPAASPLARLNIK